MKIKLKELVKICLISSVIGALVASPFNIILNMEWIVYLSQSAFVGFSIGLIAYLGFSIVSLLINHHPFIAFFVVFLIVAVGTSLAVYFFATKSIIMILCFTGLAELASITVTFISWKHSIKLNTQLKEKKSRIKER